MKRTENIFFSLLFVVVKHFPTTKVMRSAFRRCTFCEMKKTHCMQKDINWCIKLNIDSCFRLGPAMPSHLNGFEYILPSFFCALQTIVLVCNLTNWQSHRKRDGNSIFDCCAKSRMGYEISAYQHASREQWRNVFQTQFDFLGFMILSQQVV